MSRISKIPVEIPADMEVNINGQDVSVKGPKGTLTMSVASPITAKVDGSTVVVSRPDDERESRSLHGLTRTLIANMVEGVTNGYSKVLEIQGTGYRVNQKGAGLEFQLGFSHPVNVEPPEGITFKVEGNRVTVEGISKEQVGEVASNLRKIRPPEPYKGKGVHYLGENIRRKVGKAGK